MAEGTHIPNTPACIEWEAQLTDALDGLLSPEEEARFVAHKLVCPACAELYEEARKGRQWLKFLSPEPEAPEGLLEKILATTGPGHDVSGLPAAAGKVPAFVPPVWQQAGFAVRMRGAGPRLLMTAAMAFFSIALTLDLAGVDLNRLRLADMRPQMLRSYMERQLNMASVPVVRYYDHLHFVHEVEARVRDLRSRSEGEDNGAGQQQQTQPATPGESREIREPGSKGAREQGNEGIRRQEAEAKNREVLETSLEVPKGSMQSRGYMVRMRERSTPWIA
ncbi:MAG: zf-HC2 domain-containing protein [Terracidiphilus sp.]